MDFLRTAADLQRGLRGLQAAGQREERQEAQGIRKAQTRGLHQGRRLGVSQVIGG